jgi:hypothetical protein
MGLLVMMMCRERGRAGTVADLAGGTR